MSLDGAEHRDVVTVYQGRVAVVTVDRQAVRNALAPTTLVALAGAIRQAVADGMRALVLTGAGEVSFCAGMDLKSVRTHSREEITAAIEALDREMDAPDRPPLVAAVNGAATGGGFEIALRCDLVVAAEHATFHLPEAARGMVPGGGATLLPARVPLAVALEIGMLGESVDARRAHALGLVNRVVPAAELVPAAVELGRRLAANGPTAVRHIRNLMWRAATEGADVAWTATREAMADPALSAEAQEGISAFLEKRTPRW